MKKGLFTASMAVAMMGLMVAACSETTRTSMQEDVKSASQEFIDNANAKLNPLKSKATIVTLRVENTAEDVKTEYLGVVEELNQQRESLRERLRAQRDQAEEIGEEARADLDRQIADLEERYNQVLEDMKTK